MEDAGLIVFLRNICFVLFFFFFFEKAERNARNKTKTYIQQGRIEITLKEHLGRADLPVPHYSPDGQSSQEMDLSVGH